MPKHRKMVRLGPDAAFSRCRYIVVTSRGPTYTNRHRPARNTRSSARALAKQIGGRVVLECTSGKSTRYGAVMKTTTRQVRGLRR